MATSVVEISRASAGEAAVRPRLNEMLYSHSDGVGVTGWYIDSPTKEAAENF
jgi:hypothetical protein